MAWDRRVRKLCRAAAEAGSPGGGILQEDEAWCLRVPGSGLCSPAGPPGVPVGCSGTASLGGSLLSLEVEVAEDSWAGCPAREPCWGVGVRWGLAGRGDTEEAAWSDGQSHRDRVFPTTCLPIFCPPPVIGCIFTPASGGRKKKIPSCRARRCRLLFQTSHPQDVFILITPTVY